MSLSKRRFAENSRVYFNLRACIGPKQCSSRICYDRSKCADPRFQAAGTQSGFQCIGPSAAVVFPLLVCVACQARHPSLIEIVAPLSPSS